VTAARDRTVPLHAQLIVAFAALSLVAVGVLLAVEQVGVGSVLDELDRSGREALAAEAAELAGDAYGEAGGWSTAELQHAQETAEGVGARLSILAVDGTAVAGPPPGGGSGHGAGPEARATDIIVLPITDGSEVVGTARLLFLSQQAAAHRAHDFLWGWALVAGAVALLAAGLVGWGLARRLARPLSDLTDVAERYAGGDRRARTDIDTSVAEVRRLAGALDTMAVAVDRSEQAQRALVADIAHELRNPLAVVQGSLEELRDGLVPADQQSLDALHTEVLRLARVVDDLGALADAEQAENTAAEPVDLAHIVDAAMLVRSGVFDDAGIRVHLDVQNAVVWGDAHRLGQVVGNLLDNCVRHCGSGTSCFVSLTAENGDVTLTVRDTGPGIPPDDLPHVLERRYRGSLASEAGSGIGLAIVQGLVATHGGTLEVASDVGVGTTVTVRLPRVVDRAGVEVGGASSP
jgi:two-component system sensor histidine kinase BaeS